MPRLRSDVPHAPVPASALGLGFALPNANTDPYVRRLTLKEAHAQRVSVYIAHTMAIIHKILLPCAALLFVAWGNEVNKIELPDPAFDTRAPADNVGGKGKVAQWLSVL